MPKKKSIFKNFKHPGGYFIIPKRVFNSHAFRDLSLTARCLLFEFQHLHMPSRNGRIVLSVETAAQKLGVALGTVRPAFRELEKHGFIECRLGADWPNGRAREWRLTYEGCNGREPTDEWVIWEGENKV